MPTEDFLTGTILFALMLLAVLATTGLVVQRRLAHLDRLERVLGAVVVATAVLIGVHLLPLLLGILNRATVLAAAVLAVALATRVPATRPLGPAEDRGAQPPPSGRLEWALAGTAAAIALVAFLADLGRWAGDEIVGVDPLTFHLPNIGRWIQTQSLWQIDQFVPLLAHGNYPNNGDVVLLSTVLPWHNDFLVRAPICLFLVVTAVAIFAVARELRAPAAASLLAATAVVSLPIVGLATIPRALPDSLLWATFTIGVLFLLRHARTSRRSDLVLAAIALAIAFGTKWYGISSVGVLVVVWAAARMIHREPGAPRDGLLVGAIALLGDAPWLVRNLVESGNPVFPVKIAPFGVTIFDAPRDVVVERVGFSLLDYADDPSVWGQLAGELFDGLGLLAIVCALGLIAAAILNRRPPDRRIAMLSVAAVALVPVYAWLPGTALGNPGDPSLASVNTRYAVPILILLAAVLAWAIGRLPRLPAIAFQAGLFASVAAGAYRGYEVRGARDVVLAAVGLALVAAAGWALWRLRHNATVLVGAAVVAALVLLASGLRIEQRINDGRYLGSDAAIDALLKAAPSGKRIGLAADWSVEGLTPIWPAFGTRIGNEVEYIGYFDGFLRKYPTEGEFQAALRHGGYDAIVVGRGFFPPQDTREQQWAIDAGWRTFALSTRLRVLVPPAS
jgi:Dolichyl-phosphate-mannose-protein mannosyltransferase